ncbi:MAG: fluoride efflux transporter CrcB [Steroidobacteraceae bacterium]|jgi:CrcB protein
MNWMLVAAGGALGSLARYALARGVPGVPGEWPLATMAANLLGSFVIGFAAVLIAARGAGHEEALRLFFMTGVLGGFTTYSAFALETVTLAGEGAWPRAFAYLIATVVGCALLAQAGRVVGSLLTEI